MNVLLQLIKEHEVDTLVVGYPKNMNGTIGERAQACEAMAHKLEDMFPEVKVVLWDERLSTVVAEKSFGRCGYACAISVKKLSI